MKNPTKEQLEAWRKDPNNWKFGVFYYNPEDKRLLPPKRTARMSWTTNFANSKSVALMIAIVFLIVFLMALLPKKWIL